MNVLFLAHTEEDGSLGKAACEALTAAKGLGGELTVGPDTVSSALAAGAGAAAAAARGLSIGTSKTGPVAAQPSRLASPATRRPISANLRVSSDAGVSAFCAAASCFSALASLR